MRPALEINKLYGQNVKIHMGKDEIIYNTERNYAFDRNNIVLPFSAEESNSIIYIHISSKFERLGLQQAVIVQNFDFIFKETIRSDLVDIIIGFSLVFISFFMIISAAFLNRSFMPGWTSLFIVMLSIGIMILSYSSFMDRFYPEFGKLFYYSFDVASTLLLPSLLIFFEKIFGEGPYKIIKKLNKIQIPLVVFSFSLLIISLSNDYFDGIYQTFSMIYLGSTIIIGNMILLFSMLHYCLMGDKEAIIMATGLGTFLVIGLAEVLWYLLSESIYKMNYWKFGVVFFLASLILVLVRRIMKNYEVVVEYSKQIEIYNNELQRSEKIELISHLAASIAHEVRNPLQVTRGFLQIIGEKITEKKLKAYTTLAINELDRASEIITDFLTFAKPDLVESNKLNVVTEIMQIEAILAPLANLKGSTITVTAEAELFIKGNSSKFKQALINLIKNSIEALNENGEVVIHVYKTKREIIEILIKDNGEGIEAQDLKRLGEPYYSKKSKGTGLGLMVTFRIIEAMQGIIKFSSEIGVGTEVTIQIPAIQHDDDR
ncbi:hypothetical protein PAT3040_05646 [Paenibacillus agaridevorans]|uniref:histidine kinase n=2 Tax=Paenibacillus agaridevorans TaxID=171404 RepID=A0A2R5EVZ3_9BACL|nr:hypothetical protein PAT3040_05646 [Paenibacillus agaridevorans]